MREHHERGRHGRDHQRLLLVHGHGLVQQQAVRRASFSPEEVKTQRQFSI